ncbi:hypothetical protein [Pseudomonas sp. ML2-2023-3]|uniref:hypothetical protein n=1 Tax=Pseudomonas sp. ML2-2023-3 TaxID=3122375 RepID=UPI0030CB88DB
MINVTICTRRVQASISQRPQPPIIFRIAPTAAWKNAALPRHFSASLKLKFER